MSFDEKDSDEINGIDLLSILNDLWTGKLLIIIFTITGIAIGSVHIRNLIFTYEVKMLIVPVSSSVGKNKVPSGLSGIADLIGFSVPNYNENNNFELYIDLLKSRDVSYIMSQDNNFMRDVFKSSWDEEKNDWAEIKIGTFQRIKNSIKSILGLPIYLGGDPNYFALESFINMSVGISNKKDSIIKTITINTDRPEMGKRLLTKMHETTDFLLRSKSEKRAMENIDFINRQLNKVSQIDKRASLIKMLSEQQNIIMSTSSESPFAAEPLIKAFSSNIPNKPNATGLLLIFTIAGFLVGSILALLKKKFYNQ